MRLIWVCLTSAQKMWRFTGFTTTQNEIKRKLSCISIESYKCSLVSVWFDEYAPWSPLSPTLLHLLLLYISWHQILHYPWASATNAVEKKAVRARLCFHITWILSSVIGWLLLKCTMGVVVDLSLSFFPSQNQSFFQMLFVSARRVSCHQRRKIIVILHFTSCYWCLFTQIRPVNILKCKALNVYNYTDINFVH